MGNTQTIEIKIFPSDSFKEGIIKVVKNGFDYGNVELHFYQEPKKEEMIRVKLTEQQSVSLMIALQKINF